jgi:DNA primase
MPTPRQLRYVRVNFEWESYVQTHYAVKTGGNSELRICCPSCDDSKFKCYINPDKKVFHCFKCDFTTKKRGKDVFDFVAITEGMSRTQAMNRLVMEYRPTTPEELADLFEEEREAQQVVYKVSSTTLPVEAVPVTEEGTPTAWAYLTSRGLTPTEITQVIQAHYIPQKTCVIYNAKGDRKGDIGHRVIFPIYGSGHVLVSWQARATQPVEGPKYLNTPDTDLVSTLWPYVPPRPDSVVVIAEGVLDATALRRLPSAFSGYATFSKHISQKQIDQLHLWGTKELVLFWDPDATKEVVETAKRLSEDFTIYVPDFTGWPKKYDCGDSLTDPRGVATVQGAIERRVKFGTLDFLKWELENK